MRTTDGLFAGSIPELYDRYMVPMLFDPYAADLADQAALTNPQAVLETAAGTGALSRALAARLGPQARITATDLNQAMLDRAAAVTPPDPRIHWQQADALALPFADQTFDLVACQFGVMFFPDKVQGYTEARRVLKPGGTFLFNVWDSIAENAFVATLSQMLAARFPDNPPVFMARTPHGHHDLTIITEHLKAAGFTTVKTRALSHIAKAASAQYAATAYCQGTPLRAEIEARRPGGLAEITAAAAEALAAEFGTGPIKGAIKAYVITAT